MITEAVVGAGCKDVADKLDKESSVPPPPAKLKVCKAGPAGESDFRDLALAGTTLHHRHNDEELL